MNFLKVSLLLLAIASGLLSFSAKSETTIAPAGDGKTAVLVDGKNVWPPKGPGCETYVACCDASQKIESSVYLMCQLSISQAPLDCNKSLDTVRQYLKERGQTAPKECQAAPAK